jgi:hypothetical protein
MAIGFPGLLSALHTEKMPAKYTKKESLTHPNATALRRIAPAKPNFSF